MSRQPITIKAEELDFSFGRNQVLHDVAVTATSASRLGVVGESGSGKTTLGRLLVGAILNQHVSVNGYRWAEVSRRSPLRRSVQMIHQDPYAALNTHLSAHSAVQEAAQVTQRLHRHEAGELADELLAAVGVNGDSARRRPVRLSGGQCQRVAIARALAADPAIIVADEPTSSLDISIQAQIINLLLTLGDERDLGLVLISHDLAVIRHLTDEIVVMHKGRIVESGRTLDVLDNPQHPYTRKLVETSSSPELDSEFAGLVTVGISE
jgi:peptide/nickel transport system ATP-binding protein